jgi:ubiquinone/menaquinone biosynthesis C-methylase UbiE
MTEPDLFIDRESLRTNAYADPTQLKRRIAVYEYQQPRNDLRTHVREFLAGIDGPILDVGCGSGAYSRSLRAAHPGRLIVAADLSEGMAAAGGAPNAVADATALPFADRSFDAAVALHMLYHVPSPAAAIAEIRRVLRPGGTLVISTNAAGDKAELRRVHADAAAEVGFTLPSEGPAMRFNLDEAETIAGQYFTTVQRRDLESLVTVPIAEPVVAFIDSTRSWYGDSDHVIDHVRRMVEETIAREGAFRFRTHSGFLVCR